MANQKTNYKHLSIGIDQSYSRCGISIVADGIPLKVTSTTFPGCSSRSAKRLYLSSVVTQIISKNKSRALLVTITVERIRTFTGTKKAQAADKAFGLRPDYLKSTGALIASIVDTATTHNIDVYSVTTKSWKSHVLGTSLVDSKFIGKYEKPEKALSIKYAQRHGFNLDILDKHGEPKYHTRGKLDGLKYYDDDAADSLGIAMCIFKPACRKNLVKED